jgi:hypothetical protein
MWHIRLNHLSHVQSRPRPHDTYASKLDHIKHVTIRLKHRGHVASKVVPLVMWHLNLNHLSHVTHMLKV